MNNANDDKSDQSLGKTQVPGLVQARRVVVAVIGFTVLVVGVCLLVLPGPAFIVIPAGLAILATEFVWARRWLRKAKNKFHEVKSNYFGGKPADQSAANDARSTGDLTRISQDPVRNPPEKPRLRDSL
jgi:uncharacterized protein (TIGR02611 family)